MSLKNSQLFTVKLFNNQCESLKMLVIQTPLGDMLAVSNKKVLLFLDFMETGSLPEKISAFQEYMQVTLEFGVEEPLKLIESELASYFRGTLQKFKTPIFIEGTTFQKKVFEELLITPYGVTRTYLSQAEAIGRPKAFRAVGSANGRNRLVIIVPCHRIIMSSGKLGGYSSGIHRKKWLLQHEAEGIKSNE